MSEQLVEDWGALAGLKVVDFTRALAGPYCTQMLADMGATVIKVEGPDGDMTRTAGPYHPSDASHRHAGYFHSINRNKKSIVVDMKSEAGRAVVLDLVAEADVVVENFRSGVMERLGLSYEVLQAHNERLIYAALRGFGDERTGASPYGAWPALDVVAQAMGGINSVTGPDADHPTKVGPGVGDIVPGIFLAFGIMSAVYRRQTTGKGQFVDAAMVDSVLALTERIVYQHSFGKIVPGPVGSHHPVGVPFGIFPVRDGHVSIAAGSDLFFKVMCEALDAPELVGKYEKRGARTDNRDELIEKLSQVTMRFTKAEILERLGGKLPFGPVYTIADIVADKHFAAREMLPELTIEGLSEPVQVAGTPVKMTESPGGVHAPGPALGQHNVPVLRSLGYSDEKIAELLKTVMAPDAEALRGTAVPSFP